MEPRRLTAIIVGLLVAALALFLVFQFVAWVSGDDEPAPTITEQVSLAASSDTALITRVTVSGAIVGNQDYNSIRIAISRNKRTLEILSGYQNTVTETVRFDNNQAAFESFLLAIDYAGFTKSQEGVGDDERGYCATGTRTVYEALGNIANQQRLWSGSCSKKLGTFDGNVKAVNNLFKEQIPNYSKLVRDVDL